MVIQKKRLSILFFCFALFLIALGALLLEKPTGFVIGRVIDASGKPIVGAKLEFNSYPRLRKVKTNAEGEFRVDLLPVGKYYYSVDRKGYQALYSSKNIEIQENQIFDLGTLKLEELAPSLSVSLWENTKLPEEKVSLNLSGAKVSEIHFDVYRVDLVKYLESGALFSDLESEQLKPDKTLGLEKVKEWQEKVPEADIPEFDFRARAPIDETGLYLIHSLASSLNRQQVFTQNLLLNKTELGFLLKRDESKLLVYSASFEGTPLTNAEAFYFSETAKLSNKISDKGLAEFQVSSNDNQSLVLVRQGESLAYAFVPASNGEAGIEEGGGEGEGEEGPPVGVLPSRSYKVFLYTERPLYRPGQKVYFKGIIRTQNAQGAYEVPLPLEVPVELFDARGNPVYSARLKTNAQGSFWGEYDLEEEGELGSYEIRAFGDSNNSHVYFDVEEYRKPEFKVEIRGDKTFYYSGEKIHFQIDTQYYFGAPVEAQLEYTVYRSQIFSSDSNDYSDFAEDVYYGGYGEVVTEGKMATDTNGHAVVTVDSQKLPFNQRYTLRVTAKDLTEKIVTREGDATIRAGDFYFSTRKSSFFVSAGNNLNLTVVTRNYQDQALSKKYDIEVSREKWDPIAGEYRYKKIQVYSGETSSSGEGTNNLLFKEGGYYRLTLQGSDAEGRPVEFEDHIWVSGKSGEDEGFGVEQKLTVIPEKKSYQAGEVAKLFVIGPEKDAPILITLEGRNLYEYRIEKLEGFSKTIEVPLKKEWMPNLFVGASYLGKKEAYEETAELQISPQEHYLSLELTPNAKEYRPADKVEYQVQVKDSKGQGVAAEISLGVVDESLYALKADSTNIKKFFWGPKPNQVSSVFSFTNDYSGGIAKEDAELLRKNFKDTAFWNPSLLTDSFGKAILSFSLPDNLTTWRATVLAQTSTTDVGQQTGQFLVTKPLLVRLATPRFFRERDEVLLKAVIHNYTDQEQNVDVALSVQGLEFASTQEGNTRSLKIKPREVASFDFKVLAKNPGKAKIQLLAKNAQVSDGIELNLPILPHGVEDHSYAQGEVASMLAGEARGVVPLALPPASDAAHAKLKVTLDTNFVSQLLGSVSYLVDYPYGCVEQTMSRLLPALMVSRLYQTLNLTDPVLEKKFPKIFKSGIRRLEKFQHADGGWGWWKEDPTDPFMTAYALYGLIRAQQLGQEVNPEIIQKGTQALTEILKKGIAPNSRAPLIDERSDGANLLPFLNRVAALAKIPVSVSTASTPSTNAGQALQALALISRERADRAIPVLTQLESQATCKNGLCFYIDPSGKPNPETTAWVLQALIQGQSANTVLKEELVKGLLQTRKGGIWGQTLSTALVIEALAEYAQDLHFSREGVNAKLALNGADIETINVSSPHFVRRVPEGKLQLGNNTLEIINLKPNPLFYQTDLGFFSTQEDLAPSSQGLTVSREYFRLSAQGEDANGKMNYKAQSLKGAVKPGDLVGVRLVLENSQALSYVILEDALPSGFESLGAIRFDPEVYYFADFQVHDEKVALFFNYLPTGKHIVNYAIRPELVGQFHTMPANAYEMYRPELRGSSGEARLEVAP